MTDWRGATVVPDITLSLRDHRERIRQLEANPAGSAPFDGWHLVGAELGFQNNWVNSSEAFAVDPPCEYGKVDPTTVVLRGRMQLSTFTYNDGLVAFTLPVGYRPAYRVVRVVGAGESATVGYVVSGKTFWKGGSSQGHIVIEPNGDVIPYMSSTGWGSDAAVILDPFTGGAPDVYLDQRTWRPIDPPVPFYAYQAGGTVGIQSTASGSTLGDMYLGTGPYGDCEVSLTSVAATSIALGVHCQPHQPVFGGPFTPGWWVIYGSIGSTTNVQTFYSNFIEGVFGDFLQASGPGFVAGDRIGLRVVQDNMMVLKNSSVVYQRPITQGGGLFGMGMNGASGVPLAKDFKVGLPRTLGIVLDGISFKTN